MEAVPEPGPLDPAQWGPAARGPAQNGVAQDGVAQDGPVLMCTVPWYDDLRSFWAAAMLGGVGIGLMAFGLLSVGRLGWRIVFGLFMGAALLLVAVFDFRVFLRLAQARAQTSAGEPLRVPMRRLAIFLLVHIGLIAALAAAGELFSLTQ